MASDAGKVQRVKSYCAQCGSLCPIVCQVKDGILVKVTADKGHPNANSLCPKGISLPELVYNKQRLQYPMQRTKPKGDPNPGWKRISWDEALNTIAARLKEIKAKYGAEAVAFSRPGPGGSPSSDFQEWVMRLARAFGSPNSISTTHVCQWQRDHANAYTYGQGLPPPEFTKSQLILLLGGNPEATSRAHSRDIALGMAQGAKLIVIDPRRTSLADKADLWLSVRPGTDGALLLGMLQVMLAKELYDRSFAGNWTTAPFLVRSDTGNFLRGKDLSPLGSPDSYVFRDNRSSSFQVYIPDKLDPEAPPTEPALFGSYKVKLADGREVECKTAFSRLKEIVDQYPLRKVADITGVPGDKIRQAAEMLATIKPLSYYTFLGVEQGTNVTQTNRALSLLYSLTGNFDTPGSNTIPQRLPVNPIHGMELLSREVTRRRLGYAERPLGPAGKTGSVRALDMYRAVLTGKPYPVKGLMGFGGNLIMNTGDSLLGRQALSSLDFFAQADLFLTPTAELADIVLPSSTFAEGEHLRIGFSQSSTARSLIQVRPAIIAPLYESWPDTRIIFELAKRLGMGDKFWNGDMEAAFDYQLAPTSLTFAEVKKHPRGVDLQRTPQYRKYSQKDPKTGGPRGFDTPSRKVEIYSQVFKDHGYDPLPLYHEPAVSPLSQPAVAEKYPLILICSKLLQYCHAQGRAVPSLRKAVPHPFVEINPRKAKELGVKNGEWVALESPSGSIKLQAKVTDKIPYGVVCTQHGWWQACPELNLPGYDPYSSEGANLNLLYDNEAEDRISGSLPYKAYLCNVRKL